MSLCNLLDLYCKQEGRANKIQSGFSYILVVILWARVCYKFWVKNRCCKTQLHASNSGLKSHDSETSKIQVSLFIKVAFTQKYFLHALIHEIY